MPAPRDTAVVAGPGGIAFLGTDGVELHRLTVLAVTLESYARQAAREGRVVLHFGAPPRRCISLARQATGRTFKGRDYAGAAAAVRAKAEELRRELELTNRIKRE